jgi:hypothetical protein
MVLGRVALGYSRGTQGHYGGTKGVLRALWGY